MIRLCLSAFAFMLATACSYGSAVDLAPLSERLANPAISPGDFCGVEGEKPPFTVVSSEDCIPVTWDTATRTYTVVGDSDDPEDTLQVSPVALGDGVYLAQAIVDPDDKDIPDRFQLFVLISAGDAFALLPVLENEDFAAVARRHPAITFREDRAGRPYIAGGDRPAIRAFLREAAAEALKVVRSEDDPVVVGVRDKAGAADHPASGEQARDIETVLQIARDLGGG